MMFSRTSRICWSWLSPPGVPIARNGLPSFSTTVGVSVVRGRLPPASTFGLDGLEPERLHPVAHRHAGVARDERAAEQPARSSAWPKTDFPPHRPPGSRWYRLARAVAGRRQAGCRPARAGKPAATVNIRPDPRRAALGITRPLLDTGVRGIDQRAAHGRVFRGQQCRPRDAREIRIGVITVPVRVRELHRFDDRVSRVGGSLPHPARDRIPRGCAASAAAPAPGSRSRPCGPCNPRYGTVAGSSTLPR